VVGTAPHGGNPKPARAPKTPRVVVLLRKAIEWKALLESGKVASQAEIARRVGVTRARVTQIMGMLRLAPEIQGKILALPDNFHSSSVTERILRPIGAITDQRDQLREFRRFLL
jgi:DNA-binding transcriptional MocR family regulator